MTSVILHSQPFEVQKFDCPTCGCRFETDEYHIVQKSEMYLKDKKMIALRTNQFRIYCPLCHYMVVRDIK